MGTTRSCYVIFLLVFFFTAITTNRDLFQVCTSLVAPQHGVLGCQEVGEPTHTCNVSCKEGYAFEIPPLDVYQCGHSTGYEWNFRSDGPLNTSLPRCLKLERPKQLSVTFQGVYADLYCNEKSDGIKKVVATGVKQQIDAMLCQRLKMCIVQDISIHHCEGRPKRDTSRTSVTFTVTVSNVPGSGVKSSMRQLNGALGHLMTAARTGKFTVAVGRKKYRLAAKPGVSADVRCQDGYTRVDANCMPCAVGTFYKDGYCTKCPRGSYQPLQLQPDCIECPSGTSTADRGAISARACSGTTVAIALGRGTIK